MLALDAIYSPLSLALIIAAYLVGSVSSAIIVCRLLGLPDPRSEGSGNPGATNVLRIGGKIPAAITLLGDFVKGLLPVVLGHLLEQPAFIIGLLGFAAFMGHLFPVFFRFQGGKGVATALGVLFGLSVYIGVVTGLLWLVMAFLFRYSSLAALTAMAFAPLFVWLFWPEPWLLVIQSVITLILFWRHKRNIQQLLRGEEKRIGRSNKS